MYNLILSDLFKLRKSMAIKILFGITTVSAVTVVVVAYLIQHGKIGAGTTGIWFLFSDANVMSILGAVLAGIFICGDFDNKAINDAISNGYGRGTVIVSKAIVFFCSIALILLPYAIITGIALSTGSKFSMGTDAVGFLHILTKDAGMVFSASKIMKLIVVMLTLMIVYMAQLSVGIPLAFVLKKPILVVPVYYVFTIFCVQLIGLRGRSLMFDRIFACTPFGGNYTFLTFNSAVEDILKAISVSLIFIIVMLGVTYCTFRKSEIK
ncbi:hypothetical protein [Clostridium akagii]|uniref:hypothetical protein n=1 Tax=Clostridium akagii TaxID=91623 RepID=UPI0004793068|nr:hypothetical protein [Clostridium akagii]